MSERLKFYYVLDLVMDEPKRKAVVDWAIDELQKDVLANRENIVCFVYGIAYRMKVEDGVRVAFFSKSGGADDFKPQLAVQMVQGFSEAVEKNGDGFIRRIPGWWRRLAIRIVMWLPKI